MQSQVNAKRAETLDTADHGTTQRRGALALFWAGLAIAAALAGVAGWELTRNLRTLTSAELASTIWTRNGPLFMLWAFSVPLGSVLACVGALLYARTRVVVAWLIGIAILVAVMAMIMVWSRVYYPPLFGVGGVLILVCFFSLVASWMRKHAALNGQARAAGTLKLIGYIFWLNATWFLCGETGKLHLKAFAGDPAPSPIEIMVFLALGWAFVAIGDVWATRLEKGL